MKGKHFIGLSDFSRAELDTILAKSGELKAARKNGKICNNLAGKSVAMIFEKASTRTRVSFQVGVSQLGGQAVFLPSRDLQVSRGEPVRDTARVLGRYVDMIVIRSNSHEAVVEFARFAGVPVINALTDLLHPCQIVADLLTIREVGLDLDGFKITFVGDGNNVANSWINAAGLFGFELCLGCPEGYDPDRGILEAALQKGARVRIERDPIEACKGSDVLYTDVWVSMGQDEEKEERRRVFKDYRIDSETIGAASPEVKIMHCLPAHRGEEITDEAMEGPGSIIFDQAENRLHAQKAIMSLIVG